MTTETTCWDIWSTVQRLKLQAEILVDELEELSLVLANMDKGESDDVSTIEDADQTAECGIRLHDAEGDLP